MRDRVTFCIKTIHRPHCCATLVRSIYEHCGDDRPLIYVLDDGKPELRFSQTCPDEAAMIDRLIETEYDIGLSAGSNLLVEAAQTRMVIFSDDEHVVGPQT
ncbi:MAG: glycosyltransferase family 2 protein, partial [bacterium]